MAREFTPGAYPSFPDGLATVELQGVSLAKLEAGDSHEQDRLFEICKQQGFFYLDFAGTSTASLPSQSEDIVGIAEDIFKLSLEEKQEYRMNPTAGRILGYKHAGAGVTDNKGTRDTAEFFNIPKNDIITCTKSHAYPPAITQKRPQLENYVRNAHSVGLSILAVLATKLGLPADTFAHMHRLDEQSDDHIRMTRGPARQTTDLPEIQTAGHTDFGTVTILFNWLGGLQIYSEPNRGGRGFAKIVDPESDSASAGDDRPRWLWVKPRPGCAIVNLGDSAVKFTNGLFCSGRHRVVPAPGEQGLSPRYSLVYFVRPEDDAVLKPLESEAIPRSVSVEPDMTAKEWITEQYNLMRGKGLSAASSSNLTHGDVVATHAPAMEVMEPIPERVFWKGKDITVSSCLVEHLVV